MKARRHAEGRRDLADVELADARRELRRQGLRQPTQDDRFPDAHALERAEDTRLSQDDIGVRRGDRPAKRIRIDRRSDHEPCADDDREQHRRESAGVAGDASHHDRIAGRHGGCSGERAERPRERRLAHRGSILHIGDRALRGRHHREIVAIRAPGDRLEDQRGRGALESDLRLHREDRQGRHHEIVAGGHLNGHARPGARATRHEIVRRGRHAPKELAVGERLARRTPAQDRVRRACRDLLNERQEAGAARRGFSAGSGDELHLFGRQDGDRSNSLLGIALHLIEQGLELAEPSARRGGVEEIGREVQHEEQARPALHHPEHELARRHRRERVLLPRCARRRAPAGATSRSATRRGRGASEAERRARRAAPPDG